MVKILGGRVIVSIFGEDSGVGARAAAIVTPHCWENPIAPRRALPAPLLTRAALTTSLTHTKLDNSHLHIPLS